MVEVEVLGQSHSLLSVVSQSLETDELDRESLELRLSAWQPGEWGSWVVSSELQAQLHAWLPWEDPVTVVHESLLERSVDPLSESGQLELLLLISLVERQSEVSSVEESQGLSSLVPHESLGLVSRVEWLGNNFNLFFIVLDWVHLSERVLRSVLSSNHDHSSVKSINVLNRWHAFNWDWVGVSLGSLGGSSFLLSLSLVGSFFGSLLLLGRFSWSSVSKVSVLVLLLSFLNLFDFLLALRLGLLVVRFSGFLFIHHVIHKRIFVSPGSFSN